MYIGFLSWLPHLCPLLALPYGACIIAFLTKCDVGLSRSKFRQTLFLISITVLCALPAYIPFPLACFYIGFHLISLILFDIRSKSKTLSFFICNLSVIFFACAHLFLLGILALSTKRSLFDTVRTPALWNLSLLCTFSVFTLGFLVMVKRKIPEKLHRALPQKDHYSQLFRYGWFGLAYVLFDTLPCMFSLPYTLLAWFLMGNSLLFCAQFYSLLSHSILIEENASIKEECHRLEAQRDERIRQEMNLKKMAYTDRLTGAFTRTYAMGRLGLLAQDQQLFSLAYIDMDHLKQVNDTYGHFAGDDLLIYLVKTLNRNLRKDDILARIGGDEFLVILPLCPYEKAHNLLSRIEKEFEHTQTPPESISLSFSFGISTAPAGVPVDLDRLVEQADRGMYQNKHARKKRGDAAVC